jgi:hypothetical protein
VVSYLSIEVGVDVEVDRVYLGEALDFARFSEAARIHVEGGQRGARCPVLQSIQDDPERTWSFERCAALRAELVLVKAAFLALPPVPLTGWQAEVVAEQGQPPTSLFDSFVDEDAVPLIDALDRICAYALANRAAISSS